MNSPRRYWAKNRYFSAILPLLGLSLAIFFLLSASCGGSTPQTRHYQLELDAEPGADAQNELILVVDTFGVDAAYDQTQMVYRESPYRIDSYYYQRWAAPPGRLVSDALRKGYRSSGLFKTVLAGQSMRPDAVLSGHISALEEVDQSGDEWQGHVTLELRLREGRTGELLWTQVYDEYEPMPEQNPRGLARATSRILERVVQDSAPKIAQIAANQ